MAYLQLQRDLQKLTGSAKLADAVEDVDEIIELLTAARDKIAKAQGKPKCFSAALKRTRVVDIDSFFRSRRYPYHELDPYETPKPC